MTQNSTLRLHGLFAAVLSMTIALAPARSGAITADDANDVCAPTANPCVITTSVSIVSGAILDFGTRTLQFSNGGQLDFQDGSARVLAGSITVSAWGNGARIQVKKDGKGGSGEIVARGSCSNNPLRPCLSDAECSEVIAGTCTGGSFALNDGVRGDADPAGSLRLVAYGNFSSSDVINLNKGGMNEAEVDGGELEILSAVGSVTISNRIELTGGSNAQGGSLSVSAGNDVTIAQQVDATGGDGGGGSIEIRADGDINISDDLNVRAAVGEGVGGTIALEAEGNISISGTSSTNRTVLNLNGHANSGLAGNGGTLDLNAGGAVDFGEYVLVQADGPDPDGSGGEVESEACDVSVSSTATITASGDTGGFVEITGRDAIAVDASSTVEAIGYAAEEDGLIQLVTRDVKGTCSTNGAVCDDNSNCTSGCGNGICNINNPDTGGSTVQFVPAPEIIEDPSLPACSP